jgi:hypothetical protein
MSSPLNSRCGPNQRRTDRGSAVITVLVLAAVTAVIASGFLFRSAQEAKLANRSLYQSVALNLAEAGIEEGLFAANTTTFTTANGWTLASGSTTDYVKTINSGLGFTQGTGVIYMRVENATSFSPTVIAAGVISIPNQPNIVKQIRVSAGKRRLWANGMVAKGSLTFSGNTAIDSYDSNNGVYNAVSNRGDQVSVATLSTALDPIVLNSNATIYGYVATGADDPVVGANGRIYGATTPVGTAVDTTRIRHDFSANLPDSVAPTTTAMSIPVMNATISLPRAGDTVGTNGRYLYTTTSMTLAGTDAVTITGPVDIIVTDSIGIAGNAGITVSSAGASTSLNIYCPGTISIAGNGLTNLTNVPAKTTIWGTAASGSTQSVNIAGNGSFTGTIYAPNGQVSMTGNGDTNGAIIAKTVTVGGNGKFHYDIQLAALTSDSSYRVSSWVELSAAAGSGNAFARDSREPFTGHL